MKPSFTAHAAANGDHDKVFNFVTPAKRWAKKRAPAAAEEVQDRPRKELTAPSQPQEVKAAVEKHASWEWGQQLSDWGYDPQEAQASGMMGDPQWYYRMLPYLQQQGPEFSGGHLSALQARNEAMRAMMENVGTGAREGEIPGLRRWYEALKGGTGATVANAAKMDPGQTTGAGYQAMRERMAAAVQRSNPELSDGQVYKIVDANLGTEKEFMGELGSKLVSEGAPGPNLESLSPWFLPAGGAGFAMRAAALPQSLTGRALYYTMHPPETPEEIRESEMVNAALEGAQRSKELESARRGASPLMAPLWALKGLEESTLGFTGSGIDEGRADFQRALKALRTGGTSANQILLEQLQRQREQLQRRREIETGGAVGREGLRTGAQVNRLAEREQDRLSRMARFGTPNAETGLYEDPFVKAEAMRKNPYMNLGTLDVGLGDVPLVGTMTGAESAAASRKWSPSEWGGMVKDFITGGDTTHDYMMRADPVFGKDRFQGYQQAMKAIQSGNWDPRTQSLQRAGIRVADPGMEAPWYNPVSWFGWRTGGHSGVDPKELKKQFERSVGTNIRYGRMSERDLGDIEQGLGEEGRKAVGWDQYKKEYTQNRPWGAQSFQFSKTGAERAPVGRWLSRRVKQAAAEAPLLPQPEFMNEFYRQQILRRQELARRMRLPQFSDERRLTDPEETFGRGLYERTHFMGPGRHARNVLPLFQRMMTDQDLTYFDPYVRKQKAEILAGRWRPGMALAPHAQKRRFGWQNPLGGLGRFLGTVPGQGQEAERLIQGVMSSPEYRKTMNLYHQGMLTEEELRKELGGLPSTTAKLRDATMGFGDPLEQGKRNRRLRADIRTQKTMDQAKELSDTLRDSQVYSYGF